MILTNILVGLPMMLLCLAIQVGVSYWSVNHYIQQTRNYTGEPRVRYGLQELMIVMIAMMLGTFVQVILWGVLFIWLGEFTELYEAVYHSAVNFASLGYGDFVMQKPWKLLGPLEAINGVLMLSMSAAALMAILQHMIQTKLGTD